MKKIIVIIFLFASFIIRTIPCLLSYFLKYKRSLSNKIKYKPNIKPPDILFICQCLENMFSFLLNMNIFTYFWLKNPHPDSRFKLGSLTYEEMASQDTCDKHRL